MTYSHGPAHIKRQVPRVAAVRANGEMNGVEKMCVISMLHTLA